MEGPVLLTVSEFRAGSEEPAPTREVGAGSGVERAQRPQALRLIRRDQERRGRQRFLSASVFRREPAPHATDRVDNRGREDRQRCDQLAPQVHPATDNRQHERIERDEEHHPETGPTEECACPRVEGTK